MSTSAWIIGCSDIPANTVRWNNDVLMLGFNTAGFNTGYSLTVHQKRRDHFYVIAPIFVDNNSDYNK